MPSGSKINTERGRVDKRDDGVIFSLTGRSPSPSVVRNVGISFGINLIFALFELVGGYLTGSVAIIANAIHDLADSMSLVLGIIFTKMAGRATDKRFRYGYRRLSLLSVSVSCVVFLVVSAVVIFYTIPRLTAPISPHSGGMLAFAVLGVLVNAGAVMRLRWSGTASEKVLSLRLVEDTVTWLAVVTVAVMMMFFDVPILDPLLALFIIAIVVRGVSVHLWRTLRLFLQATPEGMDIDKMRAEIISANADRGVLDMHGIRVWSLDGSLHVLSAHVVMRGDIDFATLTEIKARINDFVRQLDVGEVLTTIEFEHEEELCMTKIYENI